MPESTEAWRNWNRQYINVTTSASAQSVFVVTAQQTASTDVVLGAWEQLYTNSPAVTITISNNEDSAWLAWNDELLRQYVSGEGNQVSPEELQRRHEWAERERIAAAEMVRANIERIRAQEKRKAASARARAELRHWLDADQWKTFEKQNHFIVHSRDGERIYRVEYGRQGNVKLISPQGKELASFCIHPDMNCPNEDTMAAQKLMLETDEKRFLAIANRTYLASQDVVDKALALAA